MKTATAYKFVVFFAVLGLLLSGYLSYRTLFTTSSCSEGFLARFLNCGVKPVYLLGLPNCVYGFFMFLAVALIAVVGLTQPNRRNLLKAEVALGALGTLFAAGLSVYELWIIDVPFNVLPACVYGFFLYLGSLIVASLALKQPLVPPAQPPVGSSI